MTLKTGDLIVIENTGCLQKPIDEFHKKWASTSYTTATAMATVMVTALSKAQGATAIPMTENETGKQVKLKYYGLNWKELENNRLVGIVTEILKEQHRDFDVIKVREQTGGVRYCRRYILENI